MTMTRPRALFLPFLCIFCMTFLGGRASLQNRPKIFGEISDTSNSNIAGVLVRIYRGNHKVGEYRTRTDGKYSIDFDSGDTITLILYEHTDYGVNRVNNVSGSKDTMINKVMTALEEGMSDYEKRDLALTLEQVYIIDKANGISDSEFRARYVGMIRKAELPERILSWLPPARQTPNERFEQKQPNKDIQQKPTHAQSDAAKKCKDQYETALKEANKVHDAAVRDAMSKNGLERANSLSAASKAKQDAIAAAKKQQATCMVAAPKK